MNKKDTSNHMKILITTPIFPPEIGGPATYSYGVAKRLIKKGHEIKIVTLFDQTPKKIDGIKIFKVKANYNLFTTLIRQSRLFFTILHAAKDVDLIYLQGPVVVGLATTIVAKILGKPVVIKFVGDIAWETAFNRKKTSKFLDEFLEFPEGGGYIKFILQIQRFVFKNADMIITPSNYLKKILTTFYYIDSEKIKVIYNSIDLRAYDKTVGKKFDDLDGYPVITTIARLVPWKCVNEIIEAVPKVIKKYPTTKLLIVGDGPEKENLEKSSVELGISNHVRFTGNVGRGKVIELLKKSDIFILNSRYEGLPHVVIEAMACKIPVIATNISGTKEVVVNEKTGMLIEAGNIEDLVKKIFFLLENEDIRKKLVEEAYKKIVDKFTWDKNLCVLEKTLEESL